MSYLNKTKEELQAEYAVVSSKFASCKEQNLKLNMASCKPGASQLDIVSDLLT